MPSGSNTQVQTLSSALCTRPSPVKWLTPQPSCSVMPSALASSTSKSWAGISSQHSRLAWWTDAAPEAARRARRVDGDVAAADHEHLLAGQVDGFAELDVGEEGEGALDAVELLAGDAQPHGLVRARRHQDGVEAVVLERRDVVHARVGRDLDADRRDVGDVVVDDVVREAVRRDAEAEHAARLRRGLEDLDAVALAGELPGGGEAGRARADDGDLLAVLLGLLAALGSAWP